MTSQAIDAPGENESASPPVRRRPNRYIWLWALLLTPFLLVLLLAACVASCFHLSSEARALRNGLLESSGVEWRQQIALNANWLTLGVVRAGLSCVKLHPAARAAVRSVQSAGVGVYELSPGTPRPDRAAMFAAADSAMTARGWERVVGVVDKEDMVAIYLPAKNITLHHLKCCVMVFDGKDLVVVSARGNPEPILNYAIAQSGLDAKVPWLVKR